ncbi:MAG TPA: integrase core domain-containing protein [Candidatus Angelobacter sp.]
MLFSTLRKSLRSRAALQAEILALRHQLVVLQRSTCGRRLRLRAADRVFWVWLSRLWQGWRQSLRIIKPETVIAWSRKGFRLYWTWKSRARKGRPREPREIRELIRRMSLANPRWGAPRIHGELQKLGINIGETTVAKYMVRHRSPSSQTWKTFLKNHMHDLVSTDFFVVPTATFRLLFVFLVLSHERRRVVHFAVTGHPTAEWTAQQLIDAFPWDTPPRYLLRDRDGSYGELFPQTARAMQIRELLTAPRSPWQNAYVERLIGSIRRDCLDHVLIFNQRGLRRILQLYFGYYERSRTHLSLAKDAPISRPVQPPSLGRVVEMSQVGGLHHRYERRAA